MYLYPTRRAHQMSSFTPPLAADSPPFLEVSAWPERNASRLVGQARHWYKAHFWSYSDYLKLTIISKQGTSIGARLGFSFHLSSFLLSFYPKFPFFKKNGNVPEKYFNGKIFKIYIFVLKHVLDHSKSIPTKKFFSENF